MKKINKIILPIAAIAMTLAGCGESKNLPNAKNPIMETQNHYVEGTLHNVDIRDSSVPFITNGVSDYAIVTDTDNSFAITAANFIKSKLLSATGCSLPVINYTDALEYTSASKYIVFGVDALTIDRAGVSKTSIDLEVGGFQITTKDKSAFIIVNHSYGYQQAAYAFLKYVAGYDRISNDITVYKKDCKTLPYMNIIERADYQDRTQDNKTSTSYAYETGFRNVTDCFYHDSDILFVHNSFSYLPPAKYKKTHPSWFGDDGGQLCYTSHGDVEEYEAMIQTAADRMIEALETNEDANRFAFTIEDIGTSCTCSECKKAYSKYGCDSGAVVQFTNDLDNKVQAYLEAKAEAEHKEKRFIEICFFAYLKMEKAPTRAVKDASGEIISYEPLIKCNPNVCVFIAPIHANYAKSFYDESNYSAQDTIKAWETVSERTIYWLYDTNFKCYFYPIDSYSTMIETYRYCAETNAKYVWPEGQHNQSAVTAFGRFKEYLNQIALFNVNSDYNEIVDNFFKNYFGPAEVPMKKFFDELQEHMQYLTVAHPGEVTGSIYDQINQSAFWPKRLLDRWMGYVEEAYDLISEVKYEDAGLYKAYFENITLESLFPRYATLEHHSGKFTMEDLQEYRYRFMIDANNFGISNVAESAKITELYETWGF